MSPLIKKALFRIKKLKRPPIFGGEKRHIFRKRLLRSVVAILMTLLVIGVIYSGELPMRTKLNVGDIATEDIYAPFGFSYEAGLDEEKTKRAQAVALEKVLDIYNMDSGSFEEAKANAERFFSQLLSIKESKLEVTNAKSEITDAGQEITDTKLEATDADLEKLKGLLADNIAVDDINRVLNYPDVSLLKEKTIDVLNQVYSHPIISTEEQKRLLDSKKENIIIYQKTTNEKTINKVEELLRPPDTGQIIKSVLSESEIVQSKIRDILYKLILSLVKPNITLDQGATESVKKLAASSVAPIYTILERAKGEIIIRKGQRATKDHLFQLTKIEASSAPRDIYSRFWGLSILITILTFVLFGYLKFFEPRIFTENKFLLLISISLLFAAISARIIVFSPLPSYFIPVATVPILLTILVGGSVAAIAVVAAAIIVALIAGCKFNIFLVSIVGGMAAICTVYQVRHRGQIIKSGLYVGLLNFITICALGILSNFQIKVFLKEGLWGLAGGITSAAMTMVFLPLLESAFKITTDIKLLELADLNHPLLRKMVTEAPGTYHHSMVVGNLSEAACDIIKANSLLARVGSYYHDIGKIEKAEYFAENQRDPLDTHSRLSPSMSSLIITNHVKDGVELAEKHKLGNAIKDIIEQHHGSGLVTYFYHQAIEKTTEQEREVSEEGFRYPGPKPQAKESAVVMLADSVEAASRVLQNPTPQRLKELVRKIVNNKFIDRQLDECDLTLEEINKIADSFVKILTGIYHSRIEYPSKTAARHADINSKPTKNSQA